MLHVKEQYEETSKSFETPLSKEYEKTRSSYLT